MNVYSATNRVLTNASDALGGYQAAMTPTSYRQSPEVPAFIAASM